MEQQEVREMSTTFSQDGVETVATLEGGAFAEAHQQFRLEGENNIVIVMQDSSGNTDMQTVSRATISHSQPQSQILDDGSVGVTMTTAEDVYGGAEGGVRVVAVDVDGNSVTWSSQAGEQIHTEEVRDSEGWSAAQNSGSVEMLNVDGSGAVCLVCGDKASGYHYSVFSCEGCKGFFKRTVQKTLQYSCKEASNCPINKFTRNSCQHCRFNKCLSMGMKKEAVREDRSPGGKHRHKRQRTDDLMGVGAGEIMISENQEFKDPLVDRLIAAQPDRIPKAEGNASSLISANGLMQYGYMELKFIIQWAKKVPGFQDLDVSDQMALLKSSFMELNVFRLAFRSMGLEKMIKFAEQVVIPVEEVQSMGWGKELVNATVDFAHRLVDLNLDLTEFCILNAIVLTYPDASGIQDKVRVLSLQSRILDCLRRYMVHRHPSDQKRFSKMLLRLPALRTVSAKAAERFLSLTLDGSIQLNDLVLEMIN